MDFISILGYLFERANECMGDDWCTYVIKYYIKNKFVMVQFKCAYITPIPWNIMFTTID